MLNQDIFDRPRSHSDNDWIRLVRLQYRENYVERFLREIVDEIMDEHMAPKRFFPLRRILRSKLQINPPSDNIFLRRERRLFHFLASKQWRPLTGERNRYEV